MMRTMYFCWFPKVCLVLTEHTLSSLSDVQDSKGQDVAPHISDVWFCWDCIRFPGQCDHHLAPNPCLNQVR